MIRIYVKRIGDAAGHVFKSHSSVKEDKVAILHYGFVTKGFITEEEWAKSQQTICEKLGLYVSETVIDGRTKLARNLRNFSWQDIFKMRKCRTNFKAMGYKTVSNSSAITIEISNCGSMVRYRMEDAAKITDDWQSPVSEWTEIHYDLSGEPYFNAYGSKQYLNQFMKF